MGRPLACAVVLGPPPFGVTYGPIQLVRDGVWTVVKIQVAGDWFEVIREIFDNNFDHTVYSSEIADIVLKGRG